MSGLTSTELEQSYERTVRADIEVFRQQAEAFLDGSLSEDDFRGARLRRGVYGQRQPAVHMIRTKIPGGQLLAHQMDAVAEIAEEFAEGKAHLTTRQNVQFHFIPTRRVADLLHRLADCRLTTREACYNTVRNVTASPLAGLLADEVFDVRPYLRQVAFAFLHQELTDNLPRKFKIAFQGSPTDDMALGIHDLGMMATIRDGQKGFRVVAAGGLGPLPVESQVLDEFLPVEQLVARCESVIRVFNKYGNRGNRNKARLKFVIRERGWEWFKEKADSEFADILNNGGVPVPAAVPEGFGGFETEARPLAAGASLPVLQQTDAAYDRWLATNVRRQRTPGYRIVTFAIDQGNLTTPQMRALAKLARECGDGILRVGIDQNLCLAYVPESRVGQVYAFLRQHDLAVPGAGQLDDVVTCPGAYSCNLALTKTMGLGAALASAVRRYQQDNGHDPEIARLTIRASGCPNACGQHWIGDFGFYGNARKINGREIPYYLMLLGGGTDATGAARFGLAVQSIPARSAPLALTRVLDHFKANRQEGESFRAYVMRFKVAAFRELTADLTKPAEIAPEMYRDWGDDVDFSLELGRGECAA
jgi:sulfite reductase beta subunit-like hemoprotein